LTGSTPEGKRIRQQFDSRAKAAQAKRDLDLEAEGLRSQSRLLKTRLSESQMQDAEIAINLIGDLSLATLAREMLDLERRAKFHGLGASDAMAFSNAITPPNWRNSLLLLLSSAFSKVAVIFGGKPSLIIQPP
jgi:hypothetical protein